MKHDKRLLSRSVLRSRRPKKEDLAGFTNSAIIFPALIERLRTKNGGTYRRPPKDYWALGYNILDQWGLPVIEIEKERIFKIKNSNYVYKPSTKTRQQ